MELDKLNILELNQVISKAQNIVEEKNKQITQAIEKKDLDAIRQLAEFSTTLLPEHITTLGAHHYKAKDVEFIQFVLKSFSMENPASQEIMTRVLKSSLYNAELFEKVAPIYPKLISKVIQKEFKKNRLRAVKPDIFLALIEHANITLTPEDFSYYFNSNPILKIIVESTKFDEFFKEDNHLQDILSISLNRQYIASSEYLINHFKLNKTFDLFIDGEWAMANFFKTDSIKFFEYIINEFDFSDEQLKSFRQHFIPTKFLRQGGEKNELREQKWRAGLNFLFDKKEMDKEFINDLNDMIKMCPNKEFLDLIDKTWNYRKLNSSLSNNSGHSLKIKI